MVMAVSERRACRAVGPLRDTQRSPVPPVPGGIGWSPDQIDLDAGPRDGEPASRAEAHPISNQPCCIARTVMRRNRLLKRLWRAERRLVPQTDGKKR